MYDHLWLDRSCVLYEDFKEELKWSVIGVPFDSTESFLPGQRLAPKAIREMLRFKDMRRWLNDLGNVIPIHGYVGETLGRIYEVVKDSPFKVLLLGGEHTITYGAVKALYEKYNHLQIVYFDAHYDVKNTEGRIDHSSFMRYIVDEFCVDVFAVGVRRYDLDEKEFAKKHFLKSISDLEKTTTYISIDLDYFDVSLAQGCADKESNGYLFEDFASLLKETILKVSPSNVVGVDIVELNPLLDTTKVTTSLCCDIIALLGMLLG